MPPDSGKLYAETIIAMLPLFLNKYEACTLMSQNTKKGFFFYWEVLREVGDFITQLSCTIYLYNTISSKTLGGDHTMPPSFRRWGHGGGLVTTSTPTDIHVYLQDRTPSLSPDDDPKIRYDETCAGQRLCSVVYVA